MRVVVALGGNALQKRGEPMTVENQRDNVRTACRALSPVAMEHELVISHGRRYKSYRGMGSEGAMNAGSADRYRQADKLGADGKPARARRNCPSSARGPLGFW